LLVFPEAQEPKYHEMLFLRETNEHIAIWEGHKFTKEEAREISGIKSVYWLSEFHTIFNTLMAECACVYLNTNEHTRATIGVETRDARFIRSCQQRFPLHHYERAAPLMQQLRAIKSPREVEMIQKACDLTEKGFRRVLPFVKPGIAEYEVQAEYAHEFLRHGAGFAGYDPIIASGANACVLHYIDNNQICQDGDLLLMDVAAGYANYHADMTRTIPVNGRFTQRQKKVYQAVLRVMKQASEMLVTGQLWDEYQHEVGKIMTGELIGLGLLSANDVKSQPEDAPLYKKYFMHGTSHFLGLDVHDVGSKYRRFEPGMVFTCEPGIYIREEGLSIRLENNYLITESGNIDLMKNIPIELEEIEELMNQTKALSE
jgi:Xaa-Pro aminopeptidase